MAISKHFFFFLYEYNLDLIKKINIQKIVALYMKNI